MKLQQYLYIFICVFCITVISSCISSKMAAVKKSRETTNSSLPIRSRLYVFHQEDHSLVYFRIKTNNLLYMRPSERDSFIAKVKVNYRLLDSFKTKNIIDSASYIIYDTLNFKRPDMLEGKFRIKTSYGKKYELEVDFTDLNRKNTSSSYISIDKISKFSRQNFYVSNLLTPESPLYNYYVNGASNLSIYHEKPGNKKLTVRYYNRNHPLPPPPHSGQEPKPLDFKADSIFYIYGNNNEFTLKTTSKGFYHLTADSSSTEGLTIFCYNEYFPENNTPDEMIKPMRFITNKQEYNELENFPDKKVALENFWLRCTGNKDKARQMIKIFYSRVNTANEYFSSFDYGWKTDRGLIFIVFGYPSNIYKDEQQEIWQYGEENSLRSINFTFNKSPNPFTSNDYILSRSEVYKDPWTRLVDAWRQGRVMGEK